MGLFMPDWRDSHLTPAQKNRVIRKIASMGNQKKLAGIAREAKDRRIRTAAAEKLEEAGLLTEMAFSDPDREVREAAVRRLAGLDAEGALVKIAMECDDGGIGRSAADAVRSAENLARIAGEAAHGAARESAVGRVEDPDVLSAAMSDDYWGVRNAAVRKITDPEILRRAALTDPNSSTRAAAVENPALTDQAVLAEVATRNTEPSVALKAVESGKLKDPALLKKVAMESGNDLVRQKAVEMIDEAPILAAVAGAPGDKYHWAAWTAALKLSRIAPEQAVEPLVRLMELDRGEHLGREQLNEALHFLADRYRSSASDAVRKEISSLSGGRYGHSEVIGCQHGDTMMHFDLGS